ncbi:isoprenoid biosynthesis glyoxalase ElbB [Candidatus Fermentibacteria bacterium]|nr:isoprenoid biosynthesis glyoxalase ElbB [Candidatus Fermentibacteria bacterium]
MGKRVAFVLSGCGHKDGTEIHEAVSALIALDSKGFDITFVAPDKDQTVTKNFLTDESLDETRKVLLEGARIARGDIKTLDSIKAEDYDLVVLPGGFGAALNLCDFAIKGENCTVDPEVRNLLEEAKNNGKPIGAMCIAPVIPARLFPGVTVTIGNDAATASKIEQMGARHRSCPVDDAVTDEQNRIVTTPAYMLARGPAEVYNGAVRMVEELEKLL